MKVATTLQTAHAEVADFHCLLWLASLVQPCWFVDKGLVAPCTGLGFEVADYSGVKHDGNALLFPHALESLSQDGAVKVGLGCFRVLIHGDF